MKEYIWNGKQYQFDEKKAPSDAVPIDEITKTRTQKAADVVKKILQPKNKAREIKNK